jgi:hypothetical protein
VVKEIKYLGTWFQRDGSSHADIAHRRAKAQAAFELMAHLLERCLSASTRGALYVATVHATLLHGPECWNPSKV